MPRVITATLTQCAKGKPLAVLENLPGDRAELRPSDLRRLARLLNTIAIDAELATHKTTLSYERDGAKA